MSRQILRKFAATVLLLLCLSASAFAQLTVLVNNVGYEKTGTKRAVVQSSSAITATEFEVVNSANAVIHTGTLVSHDRPAQWSNSSGGRPQFGFFATADFSEVDTEGEGFIVRVGSATSAPFAIGEKILQTITGADQINFFYEMRHGYHPNGGRFRGTMSRTAYEGIDSNIPLFGSGTEANPVRRNLRGGWWDASGDAGKHLSHLAYSNYFTPQQIPMVVWALLHANEAQPEAFGTAARSEAAWGADYLLRSIAPEGFFYMSIFDRWGMMDQAPGQPAGSRGSREVCAWGSLASVVQNDPPGSGNPNSTGRRYADYQSALREGGGVSIAALARAGAMGVSGDSSSAQYIAGAVRAYAHLMEPANYTRYQDDGVLNIIDFYAALLAATELYNAVQTNQTFYLEEAERWVDSLLSLQTTEGWFLSGNDARGRVRPFYHAAEEGFPVVALSRFFDVIKTSPKRPAVREAVRRNLLWYNNITYTTGGNPFEYAKMWRTMGAPTTGGVTDLARNKTATASREEANFVAANAFDGNTNTRWSSFGLGMQNDSQWIAVDLGQAYMLDSVVLRWEGAYGVNYRIEVSQNGTDWTTAVEITNNTTFNSRLRHAITPAVSARYVRMFGITRGNEHGSFSLWDFEVYGATAGGEVPSPYNAFFFIPKDNETGYWWQGENARLASMASAFIMGAHVADPTGEMWDTTLFQMATAQLDWILGRNPFDLTMMYGYGRTTYSHFPASFYLENIKGGICNGISSMPGNENNIAWMHFSTDWVNWRFAEQWLPHNAWYLTAISALSHRLETPFEDDDDDDDDGDHNSVRNMQSRQLQRMQVSVRGRNVRLTLPFAAGNNTTVAVYNLQGRKIFTHNINVGERNVSLRIPANVARGTYILNVGENGGRNNMSSKINLR